MYTLEYDLLLLLEPEYFCTNLSSCKMLCQAAWKAQASILAENSTENELLKFVICYLHKLHSSQGLFYRNKKILTCPPSKKCLSNYFQKKWRSMIIFRRTTSLRHRWSGPRWRRSVALAAGRRRCRTAQTELSTRSRRRRRRESWDGAIGEKVTSQESWDRAAGEKVMLPENWDGAAGSVQDRLPIYVWCIDKSKTVDYFSFVLLSFIHGNW